MHNQHPENTDGPTRIKLSKMINNENLPPWVSGIFWSFPIY